MPRGRLRVYLGVAPGAGKTHALLDEAHRRAARGADVVVAAVDTRGRAGPAAALAGLEIAGDGRQVDVGAVLARRPAVVIVDDLQAVNPDGARHQHRWQDVEELLAAGVDVVAAVDVRYVASLADVVEQLTGTPPDGVVPDRVLRDADQLQLVDIAPHALRRRLAHGGLHPAPRADHPAEFVDAEMSATFRLPVLAALRELALGWAIGTIAHQHASAQDTARDTARDAATEPPVHERILVALSGGPGTDRLLARAARLVARMPGAELHAVHVLSGGSLPGHDQLDTAALRDRTADVGGTYQQVIGDDVAGALLAVAEAEHATQLVVGADGHRGPAARVRSLLGRRGGDTAARLLAAAPGLDVHVVPTAADAHPPGLPRARRGLPRWRRWTGLGLALVLPALTAVGLRAAGPWTGLAGDSLLFLLTVIVAALVGGLWPALTSAVIGSTLLNYFFIPPLHTLRVSEPHNVITLLVFVLVAGLVSAVVQRAASAAAEAARASAESRSLSSMASGVLRGEEALPTLMEHVRSAFGMTSASLLERTTGTPAGWRIVHAEGPAPPARPEEADVTAPAGAGLVLALSGRTLAATDRTMLRAFAAQAQGLLERDRLTRAAAHAARLEATERLRDALLAAVGHDLRTPLASARAAVSSLQAADVAWSGQERTELLATAEESLARLSRLVADLLDLSRLRAGVLAVKTEPVWLDDVIPPALDELGPAAASVTMLIPADLPPVSADAALLSRALVNVLGNALRHAPPGVPPVLAASSTADRVELRVIDRGPGVAEPDKERIFVPFQRLGDTDAAGGLGLGLALSRGLVDAMHGTLEAEDTPGGGLTMVLSLPAGLDEAARLAEPGRRERKENSS